MIKEAFAHVVSELNGYFNVRSQIPDRAVAGSLFNLQGKVNQQVNDKVVMSLVNVEEDRTYRSVETFEKRPDGTSEQVKPPIKVNLYVLFVANLSDYEEAVKAVDQVMSFFQHRPAFDYASIAELADREGRMVFELHSLSFEQVNHLWGALGAKYMPSVLYKVGVVDIRDRQLEAEVPPVQEIDTAGS